MNLDSILDSREYKCKLSEHLTSLLTRTKSATTEASISFAFESEIYFFVRSFFNIDIKINKEESQSTLRHKFTGRIDAVTNNLVVEYKRRGKLDTDKDKDKASLQLKNYLEQLYNEEGHEYYGVLTDGIKIRYIYYQSGELHSTSFKNIDENDLDKLVQSLIDLNNKKFVPKNIVDDFKLTSVNKVTYELANYLFKSLVHTKSQKTSMLFQEWEVLFHLSETDKGQNDDINKRRKALGQLFNIEIEDSETDYKALFALQTSYAIIVKLIACKVVTKIEFNQNIEYFSDLSAIDSKTLREFIQYIEDGYVFQTGGIRNLLEGDFFSWYCAEEIWSDEEAKIILKLINLLESYSISFYRHGYNTVDIFIDLYMEIMPAEVRHSLGEYFTPSWLADYVVRQSKDMLGKEIFTAIDPCCGSGVFVMALIRNIIGSTDILMLSAEEKSKLLHLILENVKGVDINPLSVLTAKVCFYLSIKPLITNEDIEIPVYLGDSANIPTKLEIDDILCYEYSINTKQENIRVSLPAEFVESRTFFNTMSHIQAIVKTGDSDLVYGKFLRSLEGVELNESIRINIKQLSDQLVRLHQNNWDGIWIRIVANFMLVARIKDIDIIVGNPPWIKWEFLPQAYAEKIKSLCVDRHLFSGQTYMGAISLNICALIANVTASTWLSPNGVLAFLMPQTLMTQDSYAGFRNFYIDFENNSRMYLQKLDDWTKAGNPFVDTTEKFMTYYYRHNYVDYHNSGIPINVIKKKRNIPLSLINSRQTYAEVENFYETSGSIAYQMDKSRTGYTTFEEEFASQKEKYDLIIGNCDYKARSGVEFTPAETYFVEPVIGKYSKGIYKFRSSQFKNSKYKSLSGLPFTLETQFIKPVIKAPNIEAFQIKNKDNYCIFPYVEGNTISIEPDNLSDTSPKLFNYLTQNRSLISKQSKRSLTISRGTAFYSLSKVGPYTYSPFKVTFRDNTTLNAAVVSTITTAWGDIVMPVCAKHCPYISKDIAGNDITEDEAFYLCAILNAPIVQNYFKFTYSTRSYSINFNIKMPKYDSNNIYHVNLMDLAKKATGTGVTENIYKDIDKNYLALCSEEDKTT